MRRYEVRLTPSAFYRVDEADMAVDVFAVFYGTPSDERVGRAFAGGTERRR